MVFEHDNQKTRIRRTNHFPDGLTVSAYGDYSLWNQEQWAWEFLRRSRIYQNWYDHRHLNRPPEDAAEEDEPADEVWDLEPAERVDTQWKADECMRFGLRRAVDWRNGGLGYGPCPEFITNSLAGVYLRADEQDYDAYEPSVGVGELVLTFDLREIALVDGILERQIDTARQQILQALHTMGLEEARSKNRLRGAGSWIQLLRFLDALSARVPMERRTEILRNKGDLTRRNEVKKAYEQVRTATKRAREMCAGKYLEILALTDEEFDLSKRAEIVEQWRIDTSPLEFRVGYK